MKTVCRENSCTGCMACIGKCTKNAISIKDSLVAYNAVIDENRCVNCGMCEKVCPNNQIVKKFKPIAWQEGWATEKIRDDASSGGAASSLMKYFVENGGYVATCLFRQGEFVFEITNKLEELINFSGSKYVKSNPLGIYAKVIEKLKNGDKVLFIGLPCQVAAMKNSTAILPNASKEHLYTVDLICHGSPSPRILNMALEEKGVDIKKLSKIRFRNKTKFGLSSQHIGQAYKTLTPKGTQDMYTYAFLKSIDYTENCYYCRYASQSRVSDISLGDSWGSELSEEEKKKGISLVLCQTKKGEELLKKSNLELFDADITRAIQLNHQLEFPSKIPSSRPFFFENLEKGFDFTMKKILPKEHLKNEIKTILSKIGIRR